MASKRPAENKHTGCGLPGTAVDLQGSLRDFLLPVVEFLGILVPGMFFIFALVPAISVPAATFVRIVQGGEVAAPIASEYLVTLILSPGAGSIFLLAVFSYVFGHIFFRQDPKVPDEKSFKKVNDADLCEGEGPVRMCDAEKQHNEVELERNRSKGRMDENRSAQ
jgi:hypothetical protein